MILSIEHKGIEPDVVVMEMHGRITMGSDSQKIEWSVTQLLKVCHAKLKKAGGALYLVGAEGMVEEALAMTSVNKIVPLYSTSTMAAEDF
jgi:hypothetical protein